MNNRLIGSKRKGSVEETYDFPFHFEKPETRFRQKSTSMAYRSPQRYAEQTTPNERKVQRSWHNQARISTYAERGSPQPRNSQIRPK